MLWNLVNKSKKEWIKDYKMGTTLKDINFGLNKFCVPSVLSALTGKSTDECAAVISSISGRQDIRAVHIDHTIKALNMLRFDVVKHNVYGYSLYAVLNNLVTQEGLYLIRVPGHIVAIEVKDLKIFICDNHTQTPIDASGSARLIQKVVETYKVTKRHEPKLLETVIEISDYSTARIHMNAIDKYEDERDNVITSMGYIYYRNVSDLRKLLEELRKI